MYMLLEEGDKINFETDEYFSFSPAGGWHKIERIMKYNVNPVTWLVRRKISQDNIERNDSAALNKICPVCQSNIQLSMYSGEGKGSGALPSGEHNTTKATICPWCKSKENESIAYYFKCKNCGLCFDPSGKQ